MERRTTPGERGYTLVAIVMFLCILMILIMAVGPSVSKIMQRENEEELIFRGKQYANAILVFQRRQGRLPLKLAEMMKTKPRSIRKLFRDPMCDCDKWGLIHVGEPWPHPPAGVSGATGPFGAGGPSGFGGQPTTNPGLPGTYTQPPASQFTTPPPAQQAELPPGGATGAGGFGGSSDPFAPSTGDPYANRPIIGVYSKVHKKGIRTYKGREFYDEWGFIAGQNNDDLFPLQTVPGGSGLKSGAPIDAAPPPATTSQGQPN